ncbi:MAG: flagellar hook-length control protein FliK [Gallionellaceae bacterium]|nr:MAG: flagellar hook-length control protein FliK [Gallionellaceae bacterium]
MSNMPILSNNALVPGKAAAQANQNPNEVATQDAQPFGDVLARQISDKAGTDTKAIDIPTPDAPLLIATESVKTENIVDATSASLPADMLATLIPVAAVVAQMSSTTQNTAVDDSPTSALEQLKSATSKGTAAIPTSASSTTLNANDSSIRTTVPTLAAPENGNTFKAASATSSAKESAPVLALSADVMVFAKEVELRNKLDASVIASTPQASIVQTAPLQAMTNVSPIAAQATQLVIDTPVTQKQWGNDFSQKITWMATQQDQHAELHLNPAQLGPVDVVIKVSGDQATAQFTSAHAAVREVIEQSIPKLREMLADNGIMLGNTTVSDQAPREHRGGEFGNQRQTAPNGRLLESVPSNMSDTRVVTPLSRHNGMVDTFA